MASNDDLKTIEKIIEKHDNLGEKIGELGTFILNRDAESLSLLLYENKAKRDELEMELDTYRMGSPELLFTDILRSKMVSDYINGIKNLACNIYESAPEACKYITAVDEVIRSKDILSPDDVAIELNEKGYVDVARKIINDKKHGIPVVLDDLLRWGLHRAVEEDVYKQVMETPVGGFALIKVGGLYDPELAKAGEEFIRFKRELIDKGWVSGSDDTLTAYQIGDILFVRVGSASGHAARIEREGGGMYKFRYFDNDADVNEFLVKLLSKLGIKAEAVPDGVEGEASVDKLLLLVRALALMASQDIRLSSIAAFLPPTKIIDLLIEGLDRESVEGHIDKMADTFAYNVDRGIKNAYTNETARMNLGRDVINTLLTIDFYISPGTHLATEPASIKALRDVLAGLGLPTDIAPEVIRKIVAYAINIKEAPPEVRRALLEGGVDLLERGIIQPADKEALRLMMLNGLYERLRSEFVMDAIRLARDSSTSINYKVLFPVMVEMAKNGNVERIDEVLMKGIPQLVREDKKVHEFMDKIVNEVFSEIADIIWKTRDYLGKNILTIFMIHVPMGTIVFGETYALNPRVVNEIMDLLTPIQVNYDSNEYNALPDIAKDWGNGWVFIANDGRVYPGEPPASFSVVMDNLSEEERRELIRELYDYTTNAWRELLTKMLSNEHALKELVGTPTKEELEKAWEVVQI